jgi:hypothetical protein
VTAAEPATAAADVSQLNGTLAMERRLGTCCVVLAESACASHLDPHSVFWTNALVPNVASLLVMTAKNWPLLGSQWTTVFMTPVGRHACHCHTDRRNALRRLTWTRTTGGLCDIFSGRNASLWPRVRSPSRLSCEPPGKQHSPRRSMLHRTGARSPPENQAVSFIAVHVCALPEPSASSLPFRGCKRADADVLIHTARWPTRPSSSLQLCTRLIRRRFVTRYRTYVQHWCVLPGLCSWSSAQKSHKPSKPLN